VGGTTACLVCVALVESFKFFFSSLDKGCAVALPETSLPVPKFSAIPA